MAVQKGRHVILLIVIALFKPLLDTSQKKVWESFYDLINLVFEFLCKIKQSLRNLKGIFVQNKEQRERESWVEEWKLFTCIIENNDAFCKETFINFFL